MKELITPELYEQLRACRDRTEAHGVPGWEYDRICNLAAVFVPVRLRPEAAAPFTVLLVGQATKGFLPDEPELQTYADTIARCAGLAESLLFGARPFWRWTREVLALALRRLGHPAGQEDILGCLAWSNLAKIGDTKGNPPEWTMAGQRDLAVQCLQREMEIMRPTLVLVCAGRFAVTKARPVFEAVFEADGWDGRGIQLGRSGGVPAVFTPHPGYLWRQNKREPGRWESSIDEAAAMIADAAMAGGGGNSVEAEGGGSGSSRAVGAVP